MWLNIFLTTHFQYFSSVSDGTQVYDLLKEIFNIPKIMSISIKNGRENEKAVGYWINCDNCINKWMWNENNK
ncbi:MAG: hypothetical protein QSU88_00865, partial [Candidatus Methanoperedens sp.]|nr:hypothetical protein [Candidatus Methanoperedens sp.]